MNNLRFYFLCIILSLYSTYDYAQGAPFYIPRTNDQYIVLEQFDSSYSISVYEMDGERLSKKEFKKPENLSVRGFQKINSNEFYIDFKDKGILVKWSDGNDWLEEEIEIKRNTDGLLNYFFFSNNQKKVLLEITEVNQVFSSFYNREDELLSKDQASFNVSTNKFESDPWPNFIYQPQINTITLNTQWNNIWFSLDLDKIKFTQRFYGRLADGKKGLLHRMYDPINDLEFLLVEEEGQCEVHQVPDFNRVLFLKDNQFLLGSTNKKPEFIIGKCAYLRKENSILLEKQCF